MSHRVKLCHAKVGDYIHLLEIRDYKEQPSGPVYRVIAWEDPRARSRYYRPNSFGLYGERRLLRLLNEDTGTYRKMPHLSTRVRLYGPVKPKPALPLKWSGFDFAERVPDWSLSRTVAIANEREIRKLYAHAAAYGTGSALFTSTYASPMAPNEGLTLEKLRAARDKLFPNHCKEKPMLVNIKSLGLCSGGTGRTNIVINADSRVEDYQEAAKRLGDPGYVVSRYSIVPPHREGVLSLHYIGHPNKAGHDDFWQMVERVQNERAEERRKAEEEAERKKRREVYEQQKPVLARTVDKDGNTSYHLSNLTDAHMQALCEVLSRVGGSPNGQRGKTEDVNRVIGGAGFNYSDALCGQSLRFCP